jgi:hypothetical protein
MRNMSEFRDLAKALTDANIDTSIQVNKGLINYNKEQLANIEDMRHDFGRQINLIERLMPFIDPDLTDTLVYHFNQLYEMAEKYIKRDIDNIKCRIESGESHRINMMEAYDSTLEVQKKLLENDKNE